MSYLLALDRQLAAHRCIPIIRFTSTLVKEEIKIGKKKSFRTRINRKHNKWNGFGH